VTNHTYCLPAIHSRGRINHVCRGFRQLPITSYSVLNRYPFGGILQEKSFLMQHGLTTQVPLPRQWTATRSPGRDPMSRAALGELGVAAQYAVPLHKNAGLGQYGVVRRPNSLPALYPSVPHPVARRHATPTLDTRFYTIEAGALDPRWSTSGFKTTPGFSSIQRGPVGGLQTQPPTNGDLSVFSTWLDSRPADETSCLLRAPQQRQGDFLWGA